MRLKRAYFLFAVVMLTIVGAIVVMTSDLSTLLAYIYAQQQAMFRDLGDALQASRTGDLAAASAMVGISFLYGVFHAAGPGHGKVIISTYTGTQDVDFRKMLTITAASSVLQAISAVLVVGVVIGFAGLTGSDAQAVAFSLEKVGFALVASAGGYVVYKTVRELPNSIRSSSHNHGTGCASCGHSHAPDPKAVRQSAGWSATVPVVVSAGIRPCTGALLVLVFASALGMWWVGVLSVFAMSVGTFMTVSCLAAAAVSSRRFVLAFAAIGARASAKWLAPVISFGGGLALLVLGSAFLLQSGKQKSALF